MSKLTQSLLELNKYGSHGTMLDVSEFDINQLIKMTCLTFEGTCKAKRISFHLILAGKTLYVKADMSKIQQVVYNLIDNAIKFSHHDSEITIETTKKSEKYLFLSRIPASEFQKTARTKFLSVSTKPTCPVERTKKVPVLDSLS